MSSTSAPFLTLAALGIEAKDLLMNVEAFPCVFRQKHKRNGKAPRPINGWTLYRTFYHRNMKGRLGQKKYKASLISCLISQVWAIEPPEVKSHFARLQQLALEEHTKLFPNYVYEPERASSKVSKSTTSGAVRHRRSVSTRATAVPYSIEGRRVKNRSIGAS